MTFTDEQAKRFWSHVAIVASNECWIWQGSCLWNGYGRFLIKSHGKPQNIRAHRAAYEMTSGQIPDGLCLLHECDNRRCVNPAHLRAGTRTENLADMTAKGRRVRGERLGTSKLTSQEIRRIRLYRACGFKLDQIAERFSVCFQTISEIVRGEAWSHIPGKKAEKSVFTRGKLDAHDVIEIRRLRETGFTQQSLSELFGVNQAHISSICNHKRWKQAA